MNAITHNRSLLGLLLGLLGLAVIFAFLPLVAEAKDAALEKSRITITINQPTASFKAGKLVPRQSGESQAPRLRITPVQTEDGRIRVILPIDNLSEGTNIISVPARLLDSRTGETGGKLQAR